MLSRILQQLLADETRTCRRALFLTLAFAPTQAHGKQEWECKKNELTRKIEIKAEVYGKAPCSTVYLKPTEKKPDKEIARAKNDFALCERKADDLALKLQNADWDCARKDS